MDAYFTPDLLAPTADWGPRGVPDKFKNLPYQQFNKSDRIGKIADWTGASMPYQNRYNRYQQYTGGQAGTQYSYYHEEDDHTFQLVDTSRPQRSIANRATKLRQQQQNKKLIQRERDRKAQAGYAQPYRGRGGYNNRGRGGRGAYGNRQTGRYDQVRNKTRQPSIMVKPDWAVLEEFEFAKLAKMHLPNEVRAEDVAGAEYGTVGVYDASFDRVNPRNRVELRELVKEVHAAPTTQDDDVMMALLADSNIDATAFGSDMLLAAIMCCTRSVYSWDIKVTRVGNKVIFDKRHSGVKLNAYDALSMGETALNPPTDENPPINQPASLNDEATFVNMNYRRMVLRKGETHEFKHKELPFDDDDDEEDDEPKSTGPSFVGYKYRVFNLGKPPSRASEIKVVARCEMHCVARTGDDGVDVVSVNSLNECFGMADTKTNWRDRLEATKGAVMAEEMKNNSFKLAKWACQATMVDAALIKFGFFSRTQPRDPRRHQLLGVQHYKPVDFLKNMSLQLQDAFAILRHIIEACLAKPEGLYLLMKDPEKGALRLYQLPSNAFDSGSELDETDGEGEDGDQSESDGGGK